MNHATRPDSRPRHCEGGQATAEFVAVMAVMATLIIATIAMARGPVVEGVTAVFCDVVRQVGDDCATGAQQEAAPAVDSPQGDDGSKGQGPRRPVDCPPNDLRCMPPPPDKQPFDVPEGLDHSIELVQTLALVEEGRELLQWLADKNITVDLDDPTPGVAYNQQTNTIRLQSSSDADALVHEAVHAQWDISGRHADPTTHDRDAYVTAVIEEETEASIRSYELMRAIEDAGEPVHQVPGQAYYWSPYQDVIAAGGTEEEARAAGRERLRLAHEDGTFTTSTTGETYPEYYGNVWDRMNE